MALAFAGGSSSIPAAWSVRSVLSTASSRRSSSTVPDSAPRADIELQAQHLAQRLHTLHGRQMSPTDVPDELWGSHRLERRLPRRPAALTKRAVDLGHQVLHGREFPTLKAVFRGLVRPTIEHIIPQYEVSIHTTSPRTRGAEPTSYQTRPYWRGTQRRVLRQIRPFPVRLRPGVNGPRAAHPGSQESASASR